MPNPRLVRVIATGVLTLCTATVPSSAQSRTGSAGVHSDISNLRMASISARAGQPPRCTLGDTTTDVHGRKGYDVLLDTTLRLPRGWKPPTLESIGGGLRLQPAAADAWRTLRAKARADGIALHPISAYRSEDYQRGLFARNVRKHGRAHALKYVARPGHSEHQLGLTLDIGYAPGTAITAEWSSKPRNRNQRAASWLTSRGWRYGWVRSYQKDKVARTCYESEPWHWRYVGPAKASALRSEGVTLREFLWRLQNSG